MSRLQMTVGDAIVTIDGPAEFDVRPVDPSKPVRVIVSALNLDVLVGEGTGIPFIAGGIGAKDAASG